MNFRTVLKQSSQLKHRQDQPLVQTRSIVGFFRQKHVSYLDRIVSAKKTQQNVVGNELTQLERRSIQAADSRSQFATELYRQEKLWQSSIDSLESERNRWSFKYQVEYLKTHQMIKDITKSIGTLPENLANDFETSALEPLEEQRSKLREVESSLHSVNDQLNELKCSKNRNMATISKQLLEAKMNHQEFSLKFHQLKEKSKAIDREIHRVNRLKESLDVIVSIEESFGTRLSLKVGRLILNVADTLAIALKTRYAS